MNSLTYLVFHNFQKSLSDTLNEYESVSVMNWMGNYESRYDNTGLTEASSKKFLEDLLVMVKRGIDRKRTFSSTSSSSSTSTRASQSASTSSRPRLVSSPGLTRDMQ